VKPGITGLSQALGYVGTIKNDDDIKQRVNNDIYYIEHWTPILDLKILFLSLFRITGIYHHKKKFLEIQ
jgi:putative colanic acid biosynthesis UDP-glucose lipid carrier transferase